MRSPAVAVPVGTLAADCPRLPALESWRVSCIKHSRLGRAVAGLKFGFAGMHVRVDDAHEHCDEHSSG